MKILLVCLRFPYPPADGGTIAMYNMALALHQSGASVKIAALNTRKHFTDPARVPPWFMEAFQPESVFLDATVTATGALVNLVSSKSFNIARFDIKEFHYLLEEILKDHHYDIVQLESLYVTPYIDTIRKHSKAKIVFRAHNVEHIIWKRLCLSVTNPLKKWYLELLASRLSNYEQETLSKIDALVTLTGDDRESFQKLGWKKKVMVSPIGIDTASYGESVKTPAADLFHLGAMDWQPNIEGVNWFLKEVHPLLREKFPTLTVHLAGKGMPETIFAMEDEYLRIYGRIDDAREFMLSKKIMIVPLLSGGGMRVKIIEGLASGKIIISTTIGAEGISYTDGLNILIADTPVDFINAIAAVLSDDVFSGKVSAAARKLAEEKYDNKVLGREMLNFYETLKVSPVT